MNRITRNSRAYRFIILSLLFAFYLSGVFITSYFLNRMDQADALKQIDGRLFLAAAGIPDAVDPALHSKSRLNPDKDQENSRQLARYASRMGVDYVYTIMVKRGNPYFSASSATENEIDSGRAAGFGVPYSENLQLFQKAAGGKEPVYSESTDWRGNFRTVLIPFTTPEGVSYFAGANYRMSRIQSLYQKSFWRAVGIGIFFIFLAFPLFIYYIRSSRRNMEELKKQLYQDSLTLLGNRAKMLSDIRIAEKPVLILVNIDSFREINDFYGNQAGDFLLVLMANRLRLLMSRYSGRDELKENYQLYKMQADEYAIMMDGMVSDEFIDKLVSHIFHGVAERPFMYGGNPIHLRVAIGVSCADRECKQENHIQSSASLSAKGGKWEAVPNQADMALKRAKKLGRHYIIYDDSLAISREYEKNIVWTRYLKEAIADDRIVAYFQPIVNNKTGDSDKYECLIRMRNAEGKIISPGSFLEVAKQAKLYASLTRIVMAKAMDVFRGRTGQFSINLSVLDILDKETTAFISEALAKEPELAKRIVFELLESEGIENYDLVSDYIREIKALGCRIAIDDFGSGYSNYSHILRLDVDYIKIDASIIKSLPEDGDSQILVRSIVGFAKELGLETVAEHVHSEEILRKVVELGVDYSQGYYFGEPQDGVK